MESAAPALLALGVDNVHNLPSLLGPTIALEWQAADALAAPPHMFPYYAASTMLEGVPGLAHPAVQIRKDGLVSELVDSIVNDRAANTAYYSGQLLELTAHAPPRHNTPLGQALARTMAHAVDAAPAGQLQVNIWVGTAHVCTPLHYDSAHNLLYQATGVKRVWVFPPETSAHLHLYPAVSPGSRTARHHPFLRLV